MEHEASWDFDQIRPYRDSEIQGVIKRLIHKHSFYLLTRFLFPHIQTEELADQLSQVRDVKTLQEKFISHAIRGIIQNTCTSLTTTGIDDLSPEVSYLYISNHRDIILDPAFLQVSLFDHHIPTSRLAIGDNLMISRLVTDLMKLNKSFIVHRDVERQHLYAYSLRLSRFIRQSIAVDKESVWIAHRSGRTKDGNDHTHTAMLKMLAMSAGEDFAGAINSLNFRTMAISYEYEPCDQLKAEELFHQQAGIPYAKDDKQAMINGIREPKGRVHLVIGPDISKEIQEVAASSTNRNLQIKTLAEHIDRHLHLSYHLWPTNFAAVDLLEESNRFGRHYSPEEKAAFVSHLDQRIKTVKGDGRTIYRMMLEAYAKPVENYLAAGGII